MNPLYSQLLKYVPPPTKPEYTGTSADWDRAEKRIGVTFPEDYRWIMDTYGYGSMGDMHIHNPFAPSGNEGETELEYRIRENQIVLTRDLQPVGKRYTLSDLGSTVEVRVTTWPKRPGLFPLGRDSSVTSYAYHTKHGDPNRWTVAESALTELYFDTKLTLVKYLIRMIENPTIPGRRNLNSNIFQYYGEKYQKAKYFPFQNGCDDHDLFRNA